MASFIQPIVIDEDPAPPWNWNPVATFQTAFNAAQENKRRNEEMALENELAQILLPQKRAEAEFNLKKLAYDTERLTLVNKLGTEEIEARRRFLRTNGLGVGGGAQGGGSTSTSSTTTAGGPQYQSKFGFGQGLAQPPAKKPSWQVVTPAQPTPQGP